MGMSSGGSGMNCCGSSKSGSSKEWTSDTGQPGVVGCEVVSCNLEARC